MMSRSTPLRTLLWKELRESRPAVVLGVVWLFGPLHFWARAADVPLPLAVSLPLQALTGFAPLVCLILLAAGRLFLERQHNTWDLLRTSPVPLRRVVAAKWTVAAGLGMAFMALSSALAWHPLTRTESSLEGISLARWVIFHAVALGLLAALLLLIDTPDWGDWLGLRAVATSGALLWFLLLVHGQPPSWPRIAALAAAALTCAALGIGAAPWLAGESPLPLWRWRGRHRERRFAGAGGAWLWSEWRRLRGLALSLALWVPLMMALVMLTFRRYRGPGAGTEMMSLAAELAGAVAPLAVFAAAAALGCLTGGAAAMEGSAALRRTLPLSGTRSFVLGLVLALVLFALCSSVPLALSLVADGWVTGGAPAVPGGILLAGVALLACCYAAAAAVPRAAPFVALPLFAFAGNVALSPSPGTLTLVLLLAAAALLCAPWLAWRREI